MYRINQMNFFDSIVAIIFVCTCCIDVCRDLRVIVIETIDVQAQNQYS